MASYCSQPICTDSSPAHDRPFRPLTPINLRETERTLLTFSSHDGTTGSTPVGSFAWVSREICCESRAPFSRYWDYRVAERGAGGGISSICRRLHRGAGHGSVASRMEYATRLERVEKANYQVSRGCHD
jgi:hypothetical protein